MIKRFIIKSFWKFEIAVEESNPGTDRPNVQHPQDGDPEVGDPEAGEPETGYHEYNEIIPEIRKGPGFDNHGSVDLYWHYSIWIEPIFSNQNNFEPSKTQTWKFLLQALASQKNSFPA